MEVGTGEGEEGDGKERESRKEGEREEKRGEEGAQGRIGSWKPGLWLPSCGLLGLGLLLVRLSEPESVLLSALPEQRFGGALRPTPDPAADAPVKPEEAERDPHTEPGLRGQERPAGRDRWAEWGAGRGAGVWAWRFGICGARGGS